MDEAPLTSAPHELLTRHDLNLLRGRGPEEGGVIAIRSILRRLLSDQKGATAIEYGLIAALIVIAMMGALSRLGGGAGGMWSNIANKADTYM
jgi:pilus assembly protein Flp/PilA